MAGLTQLESKLAEVIGPARASQDATRKVIKLVDDDAPGREFMIMAEAGALGHVEIVSRPNEQVCDQEIGKLAKAALNVRSRHFEQTRAAALKLAAQEDASEPEG